MKDMGEGVPVLYSALHLACWAFKRGISETPLAGWKAVKGLCTIDGSGERGMGRLAWGERSGLWRGKDGVVQSTAQVNGGKTYIQLGVKYYPACRLSAET